MIGLLSMKEIQKISYNSVHTDYLRFAFLSFQKCKTDGAKSSFPYINRNAIETIRYSFDCLEASIKFIFFMGSQKQLPITIPENWLIRYMQRQWSALSLSDSLGLLSFAWTEQAFWQNVQQYQLFDDLRKLRNGLTHPKPLGTVVYKDTEAPRTEKMLDPYFLVHSKPIAKFHNSPHLLDISDAEKALEILFHHLIRIQGLFCQGLWSTQFSYYDETNKTILSTNKLLQQLHCKFAKYWEYK
jgi:hypothetical protein